MSRVRPAPDRPPGTQDAREDDQAEAATERPVPPANPRLPMLEKRLEDLTRLVSDWIWETDADLHFTFVSHRVFDILGCHPIDLLGASFESIGRFTDAKHADGGHDWSQPFRDLAFEATNRDGGLRHLLISGMPVFDGASGALAGVRGTARDITARRQTQAELEHQRSMFESLFRDAPDAMAVIGTRGRIMMGNPALCRMFGRTAEDLFGRSTALLHVDAAEHRRCRRHFRRRGQESVQRPFIGRFRRATGEVFSGELLLSEVAGKSGGVVAHLIVIRDVSEREKAEAALRDSEERFRNLVEGTVRGIVIDIDGRPIFANRAYARIFGYDGPDDILALNTMDVLYTPGERDRIRDYRRQRMLGVPVPQQYEVQCLRKDGAVIWVEALLRVVTWNGQRAVQSTIVDITQRKRTEAALRASEARLRAVIDNAPVAISLMQRDGRFQMVGRQFESWFGLAHGAALGRTAQELLSAPQAAALTEGDDAVIRTGSASQQEFEITLADGEVHSILSTKFPIPGANGGTVAVGVVNTDVSKRKHVERQLGEVQEALDRKANFDELTGLPNRMLFLDRLGQALLRARRDKERVALLFIDLDHFKNVNDTKGHAAGDQLLVQTARRLQGCVREEDTVARLGGDEFTVILPAVNSGDEAAVVAGKIVRILNRSFQVGGEDVFATASVGITLGPDDGDTPDDLVKNADAAMYSAKEHGRNSYRFYTQEINDKALRLTRMESLLRQALNREELNLVYQPIFDTRSGQVISFETLLRWDSAELGSVPPDQFIGLAEERGLIGPVGDWVLRTACVQFQRWMASSGLPVRLGVNVSGRQFRRAQVLKSVKRALRASRLSPHQLDLEITEGVLMQDLPETMETLKSLTDMGIGLSIDDFGTGYSSLSYLRRFPFTALKIDRSFVSDVTDNADAAVLTKAIINMGHSLGMSVIGEGVERGEQLDFLRAQGCDLIQGYHLGRPMTAIECARFLRSLR